MELQCSMDSCLLWADPQSLSHPFVRNAVPVCTCLSNVLNIMITFASCPPSIFRVLIICIFMKENTLNGLHVLFCSFDRCNPRCTRLVHQICARYQVCTCFYTCKPLVDQALSVMIPRTIVRQICQFRFLYIYGGARHHTSNLKSDI